MPNGLHGLTDELERIEAPLRRLDPLITGFAEEHGMSLERNHHDWPSRSLRWRGSIDRLIQVYLADQEPPRWNLWICAWKDRGSTRRWKQQFLLEAAPIERIASGVGDLLEEARSRVERWTADDLEAADLPDE